MDGSERGNEGAINLSTTTKDPGSHNQQPHTAQGGTHLSPTLSPAMPNGDASPSAMENGDAHLQQQVSHQRPDYWKSSSP